MGEPQGRIYKAIERRALKGEITLLGGREFDLRGGRGIFPDAPSTINVSKATYMGRGYRSIDKKDYAPDLDYERLAELVDFVDSDLIRDYTIGIEYVPEIRGNLPAVEQFLDSMMIDEGTGMKIDNRIVIRPVLVSDLYMADAEISYKRLKASFGERKIRGRFPNVSLPIAGIPCPIDLPYPVEYIRRRHSLDCRDENSDNQTTLQVFRSPIWFNPKSSVVEGVGRVPLEVMINLLEPFTSQRILYRVDEFLGEAIERMNDAERMGRDEEIGPMLIAASDQYKEIINLGLYEEKNVVLAIVKCWLKKNKERFGLRSDVEVSRWEPFNDEGSELSDSLQRDFLNRFSPSDLVQFYSNSAWNNTFEGYEVKEWWQTGADPFEDLDF